MKGMKYVNLYEVRYYPDDFSYSKVAGCRLRNRRQALRAVKLLRKLGKDVLPKPIAYRMCITQAQFEMLQRQK